MSANLFDVTLDELISAVGNVDPVMVPPLCRPLQIGWIVSEPTSTPTTAVNPDGSADQGANGNPHEASDQGANGEMDQDDGRGRGAPDDGRVKAAVCLHARSGGQLKITVGSTADDLAPCDLVFTAELAATVGALAQVPDDPPIVGRITVDDTGCGGSWRGPLPPIDLAAIPKMRALPRIAGATVLVQLLLTRSPVGGIPYWMDVRDGQLVEVAAGTVSGPEVYIAFRYEQYLRMRTGELFPSDAIRGGDLAGDFPKLQVFSGIVQSLPFLDAYRDGFTNFDPLIDYTRLATSDAYRAWAADLRRRLQLQTPADSASPNR